jgi:toxin ParE1/3/4
MHYSAERWGVDLALRYIDEIHQLFERLSTFPELGRTYPEIDRGLRKIPVNEHVVYYRVLQDRIRISHVLHFRQDVGATDFSE